MTEEQILAIGRLILQDLRLIDAARASLGVSSDRIADLIAFYRHNGLERTLYYLSLFERETCAFCGRVLELCRCDEPIAFVVNSGSFDD